MVGGYAVNGGRLARRLSAAAVFVIILLTAGPQLSPGTIGGLLVRTGTRPAARPGLPLPALPRSPGWRDAVRAGIPPLTNLPRKIRHVDPIYPEGARQEWIDGMVVLEILIDEGGGVEDARVVRSIGLLDQAALDAVRQWRFTPTLIDDMPVKVILTVKVDFALRG